MMQKNKVSQPPQRPSCGGAVLSPRVLSDSCGRHRKRAEIKRLHDEIRSLEEELQLIEGYPHASKACKELVEFTQRRSDPLLSLNGGQGIPQWNRWFQEPPGRGEDVHCCGCRTGGLFPNITS